MALQVEQHGNTASVKPSEDNAAAEAPEPAVSSSKTHLPTTQEDSNHDSGPAANGSSPHAEPALTADASLGKAPGPAGAASSAPQHVVHDSANSNPPWRAPLQTSGPAAAGWAAQRTQVFNFAPREPLCLVPRSSPKLWKQVRSPPENPRFGLDYVYEWAQVFVTDDSGPYEMVLGGVDPDAPPYEGPPFPPPDAEAARCQALQVMLNPHG